MNDEQMTNELSSTDLSAASLSADLQRQSLDELYALACQQDDKVKQALGQRYTKAQILCSIIENFGIRNQVCKALDCTKAQLARYMSVRPDLIAAEKSAREMLMDKCESTLVRALDSQSEMSQLRAAEILMKTVGARKYGAVSGTAIEIDAKDTKIKIQQLFGIGEEQ